MFLTNYKERWPSWSKARAWKVRKLQKGFVGSNPTLRNNIKTFDYYKFLTLIIQKK